MLAGACFRDADSAPAGAAGELGGFGNAGDIHRCRRWGGGSLLRELQIDRRGGGGGAGWGGLGGSEIGFGDFRPSMRGSTGWAGDSDVSTSPS